MDSPLLRYEEKFLIIGYVCGKSFFLILGEINVTSFERRKIIFHNRNTFV